MTVKVVVVVVVLVVMTGLTIDNQEKYFMIILLRLWFYLNFAKIRLEFDFTSSLPKKSKGGWLAQLANYTVYDIWNIPLQSAATKCVYIIAGFSKWAIPEKIQMKWGWGGQDILFWKPGVFHFFTLPLEISDKENLNPCPWYISQNCVRSLENSKAKNKDPRKFHFRFN